MLKLDIFKILYKDGDVNVVVDTTVEGVSVPEHLAGKLTNFVLGHTPSPQLEADEDGIVTPLRFAGERFVCSFPWPSIRVLMTSQAVVNFPPEEEIEEPQKSSKKGGPLLKVVK